MSGYLGYRDNFAGSGDFHNKLKDQYAYFKGDLPITITGAADVGQTLTLAGMLKQECGISSVVVAEPIIT